MESTKESQQPEQETPVQEEPKQEESKQEKDMQTWPEAVAPSSRSGLRKLGATFLRYHVLYVFYWLWIFGVTIEILMLLYSAIRVAMTMVSANTIPLPWSVVVYLGAVAAYFAYQGLVMPSEQKPWPMLMEYVRWMFVHYPFFRQQKSIIEGAEDESIKHPHKPMFKAKDKGMFVMHPHGVFCMGTTVNSALSYRFSEADHRCLVAQSFFLFPFCRDMLKWLGFDNVNKETMVFHMKQDRNVCLLPGGLEEASIYTRGKHRIYLKQRFGFVKLGLQYGYKLYPVYTFGEEETFSSFPFLLKLRMWLCSLRIPGVFFAGNPFIPFMPRSDLDLITVVGKPIQLPQIAKPTREDVFKYHEIYMSAIIDLFERNKTKYARDPDAQLEIY